MLCGYKDGILVSPLVVIVWMLWVVLCCAVLCLFDLLFVSALVVLDSLDIIVGDYGLVLTWYFIYTIVNRSN